MEAITPRQDTILRSVVEIHIETALPVGSRLLRDSYGFDYSSATLRHEMGTLEEKGFLMHPYTSSGRIPTDQGYRYYVNQLMSRMSRVSESMAGQIRGNLLDLSREIDRPEPFVEETSRLLAHFAREASLVFLDDSQDPSTGRRNERMRVYIQGSSHILEKPEFQDIHKARTLFRALEERIKLLDWISGPEGGGLSIRIGHENEPEALHDCSVIATRYLAGGEIAGTVAVVGPRRMRYPYTIPLVASMASLMAKIIKERYLG